MVMFSTHYSIVLKGQLLMYYLREVFLQAAIQSSTSKYNNDFKELGYEKLFFPHALKPSSKEKRSRGLYDYVQLYYL